jgi:hypothetical protein
MNTKSVLKATLACVHPKARLREPSYQCGFSPEYLERSSTGSTVGPDLILPQSLRENRREKPPISPLRYAPPDFLWNLVVFAHFMLLSLTKAAHAAMSSAAWQEIRVRSR